MPSEKDVLLVSDKGYAIVNDAVVCISKACDDRLCVVSISHSLLAEDDLFDVAINLSMWSNCCCWRLRIRVCHPWSECNKRFWVLNQEPHEQLVKLLAPRIRTKQLLWASNSLLYWWSKMKYPHYLSDVYCITPSSVNQKISLLTQRRIQVLFAQKDFSSAGEVIMDLLRGYVFQ